MQGYLLIMVWIMGFLWQKLNKRLNLIDTKDDSEESKDQTIDRLLEEVLLYQEVLTRSIRMEPNKIPIGDSWICYMKDGLANVDNKSFAYSE